MLLITTIQLLVGSASPFFSLSRHCDCEQRKAGSKRGDGTALQSQTTYLPHQLYISTHHPRRVFILSVSPKSEGCMLFLSFGEVR